jgi:zinc transport system ATP-binding protein
MPVEVLSINHLTFGYNGTEVLTDVNLVVGKGDYVGIVGPNGSGKTTLISVILGLETSFQGNFTVFGSPLAEFSEWHRIGYLPQKLSSLSPFFPAAVHEIVSLGLISRRRSLHRDKIFEREAVENVLRLVDILDIRSKLFGELSVGQQQRVLLARALVNQPEFLLLDEPTTALDPETRENFYSAMRRINEEKDVTIILITHDIGSIGKYASKLLYLDRRIIFFGSFDDFCSSEEMASYFGEFSQHLICHKHDHGAERHDIR